MRFWTRPTVLLLAIFLGSCGTGPTSRPVPAGTYRHASSNEWIRVGSSTMHFHVKYWNIASVKGRFLEREYEYKVDGDGHIFFSMSSNELAFAEFFANPWYWRGGRIARVNPEAGRTDWFARSSG